MYMLVCVAFALVVYFAVNLRNTEPLDSMFTITDPKALPAPAQDVGRELPAIHDIPIAVVNQMMFHAEFVLPQRDTDTAPSSADEGGARAPAATTAHRRQASTPNSASRTDMFDDDDDGDGGDDAMLDVDDDDEDGELVLAYEQAANVSTLRRRR
jgi:hypothetical protein